MKIIKGGEPMNRLLGRIAGFLAGFAPVLAFASEAPAGYQGIASLYYALIAVILIYGTYDTFGKKAGHIGTPIFLVLAYVLADMAP